MTEQEAIARLKAKDISGLEALVHRYYTQAAKSAYLVLDDWALAEDVAQSAFLNAYERIGGFDSSRPFGPWFLRSVINSALKVAAGRHDLSLDTQDGVAHPEIAGPEQDVVDALEAAETREEVLAALHKLSPAQRAAVFMKYYLDISDAEASRRLEVPPGTVRRRLHDARERLRKLLPTGGSE
jgi:RNA polymerase sigma-70 factor (ECF subfamily)